MDRNEVIKRTSEILGDKDYILINKESYGIHVDVAFNEYNRHHPNRSFKEISINTMNGVPFLINTEDLEDWEKGFSVIVGIELKNPSYLSGYVFRGKYLRSNFYKVEEDAISLSSNIELYFNYNGDIKIYYTVPIKDISKVSPQDTLGIVYLAGSYACLSLASKSAMIMENYIQADRLTYDRRSKSFIETSKQFREMAYRILDIPDGEKGYSAIAYMPYMERARAARVTI